MSAVMLAPELEERLTALRAILFSCVLSCGAALALGVFPSPATAQELFNACAAQGWPGLDHSAMARALELLAGHEISNPDN